MFLIQLEAGDSSAGFDNWEGPDSPPWGGEGGEEVKAVPLLLQYYRSRYP